MADSGRFPRKPPLGNTEAEYRPGNDAPGTTSDPREPHIMSRAFLNSRGWMASASAPHDRRRDRRRPCRLEVHRHRCLRRGFGEPARADGGRHRGDRVGPRAPPHDYVDRHRAGAPLHHPPERDRGHRRAGAPHPGPDRRARHRPRGARRLGRAGRAPGAGSTGGPRQDHARLDSRSFASTRPRRRKRWIRRVPSTTSPRRRWRGPARSSPRRSSARHSGPGWASPTSTSANT